MICTALLSERRTFEGQAQYVRFSSEEKESIENSPQSCRANRMQEQLGFIQGVFRVRKSQDYANGAAEVY